MVNLIRRHLHVRSTFSLFRSFTTYIPTSQIHAAPLSHYGILTIEGKDYTKFIQGFTTQDMKKLSVNNTLYTAWLNNKGRILTHSFITQTNHFYTLTLPLLSIPLLTEHLLKFNVKKNITLLNKSNEYTLYNIISNNQNVISETITQTQPNEQIAFLDPRVKAMGGYILHKNDQPRKKK
jgi:folate-binding Fe-S cluster repair protein YgfZ